ncbi:MAG TPA: aminoglycoside phosphotransferase family protein [Rhizomicrobium sp.]|nr:aminoglycoside phosphotransferase family protein [Rhizomicrobium sp.]
MDTEVSQTGREEVAAALRRMGLLGADEACAVTALCGGVSCDVWRVDLEERAICVKRALPRLRVSEDWRAPADRSGAEVDWLRLVAGIDPRVVPEVLGEDRPHHFFAMEYLPPQSHPLWKSELAAGRADPDFAVRVGAALARIHAATAGREDVAHDFAHGNHFHALRLEPYLLFTAKKHPGAAARIRALADGIARARIALMQGDISPKNILRGPDGPVFLDAETACYGDPAFDLAFCLNHLLLKCAWHRQFAGRYLSSFRSLADAYLGGVTWEEPEEIAARTAGLLPALMLARVDGKSPVEYLAADEDRQAVRAFALARLKADADSLDAIAGSWAARITSP